MNKRYQLVVFDWEGTLGDTLGQVLSAIANAVERLHFGELDVQLARQHVAFGLSMAVQKLFPHLSIYQHEQIIQEVQLALATTTTNVCLIPGAMQVVEAIKQAGMDLAIATNKGQHSLQRALHITGLDAIFTTTRSAGQAPAKPCPQMLEEIMDEVGVLASQTLMVGDSVSDIEMAIQAGVDAVGVDFYYQQDLALREAGAIAVFDDYRQLANFLNLT